MTGVLYLGDRVTYDLGFPNGDADATIIGFPHGCEVALRTDAGTELVVPFHRVARCGISRGGASDPRPTIES